MEIKFCRHSLWTGFGSGLGVACIAGLGFWVGHSIAGKMTSYRDCPEGTVSMNMAYKDGPVYQRCVQDWTEPKRKKK